MTHTSESSDNANICTKFPENTFDNFNVIEGTRIPYKSE